MAVNITPEDLKKLEAFKSQMFEALRRTRDTGREHGFNVCKEDGSYKAKDICEGDKCSVRTQRCQWPNTLVGYHTHPPGKGRLFSAEDVFAQIADQGEFMCIGSVTSKRAKDGQVACYKMDHKSPEVREFLDHWRKLGSPSSSPEEQLAARKAVNGLIAAMLFGASDMTKKAVQWEEVL